MNHISGQQQEPTESSLLLAMGASRNPHPLGWEGCQITNQTHLRRVEYARYLCDVKIRNDRNIPLIAR